MSKKCNLGTQFLAK